MRLSSVRENFGSRTTTAIRRLFSLMMPRRCSVWKTALSIWREKRCLSVLFISDDQRLCLRVQSFFVMNHFLVLTKCDVTVSCLASIPFELSSKRILYFSLLSRTNTL